MEIIETSATLNAAETYRLTMDPATRKMSDAADQVLEVTAWCLYNDQSTVKEKDGTTHLEDTQLLSILTPEGEVFATNSPTFQTDFMKMVRLFLSMGEVVHSIRIITGQSKAGRTYTTCTYNN